MKKMLRLRYYRVIVFILILTLFVNPLTSLASMETSGNQMETMELDKSNPVFQEKISPDLKSDLKRIGDELFEIIIYLHDQVDTEEIQSHTKNQLSSNTSKYQEKLLIRHAIVDSLKNTSELSQKELLEYLNMEEEKGRAADIRPFYIVNAIYVKAGREVIENLSTKYEVKSILPDRKFQVEYPTVSKDDLNLSSLEEGIEWNIDKIKAPLVWEEYGIDGTGVVVGIIDSGMDYKHEALKSKWRGYNPMDPESPNPEGNWFDAVYNKPMPYEISSTPHGTHVTGTILGQDPEGVNKIGVAPGAQWIAAKAFVESGGADSWLLAAGEWMLAPNGDPDLAPDIINNSWSGGVSENEWYRQMVTNWRNAGILPVFAAGNAPSGISSPGSISNPASYPESFAVGAVDKNNNRGRFSHQGPTFYGLTKPDIAAPGVNIRSSVPGGYEGGWNGTSMAAPHIAGVAALLLSADAGLSVDQLEDIIMDNALGLRDSQYENIPNNGYGHGLVNAYDALSSLTRGRGVIKGQVLIEGEDSIAPSMTHVAVREGFENHPILLRATVTDNISVAKVEILTKNTSTEWTNTPMIQRSGDEKGGLFEGNIPEEFIQAPGFTYKIRAIDFSGNITETDQYYVELSFGIKPDEYFTDLEEYPVGWNLTGQWQWGIPVGEPTPYSGERLLGTNLKGNYSSSTNSELISPPIDLRDSSLEEAWLRLHHWYMTEDPHDPCKIFISTDNMDSWNQIGDSFKGKDRTWRELSIDLSPYIGNQGPVFVKFQLLSDSVVEFLGWYLDNIRLIGKDNTPPEAPKNLTITNTPSGVSLEWNKSPEGDFSIYRIYRSSESGQGYEQISQTVLANYLDTNLDSGEYFYVVTALDLSGNESDYSNEVSVTVEGKAPIYSTDFEADDGGWVAGGRNNTWEWGIPTSGPNAAYTGSKLWATNLSGNYEDNSQSWFMSPSIEIPATGEAVLNFYHWYEFEKYGAFDRGHVQASKNGGDSWTDLTIPGQYAKFYSGQKNEWLPSGDISLKAYAGQSIMLRFFLLSDERTNFSGWYINNVNISMKDEKSSNKIINPSITSVNGLPLQATVSLLETNTTVKTSPIDGSYRLIHPSSPEGRKWTLRVESYGHYTEEREISLNADEEKIENFLLDPIPVASLRGRLLDKNNEPVAGARVSIVEDKKVPSVATDHRGEFEIPHILQGQYTLRTSSPDYLRKEIDIVVEAGTDNYYDIILADFAGIENEIAYDDGTDENARAVNAAKSGWAVRMTPNGRVRVKQAKIKLYNKTWPEPGGDFFKVAIFDSLPNGEPNKMIGDPIEVTGVRGQWNIIDLSSLDFYTDQDFYIVMIQEYDGSHSPGLCTDESSPFADRTYGYMNDSFVKLDSKFGNLMIRAVVDNILSPPEITNLPALSYTREESIEILGNSYMDGIVNIYINGEKYQEVESLNGEFTSEINLSEGISSISLSLTSEGQETDQSSPVTVIRDTINPQIILHAPEDGLKVNQDKIRVIGQVKDKNLDQLTIRENLIEVDKDGNFNEEISLVAGENTIGIRAIDKAGNESLVERKVIYQPEGPEPELPVLSNIEPAENLILEAGDSLQVSFSGPQEGEGYFRVLFPIGLTSDTRINMEEVEAGIYKGNWLIPEEVTAKNLVVEVAFISKEGLIVVEEAPGRITITAPEEPVDPVEPSPIISNIIPGEDLELRAGDQLEISCNAPEGREVYYRILFPASMSKEIVGVKMDEIRPGYYKSIWTVAQGLVANNLEVEIVLLDEKGKRLSETAEGKITVVGEMADLATNTIIIGNEAFEAKYLDNNKEAQSKLSDWLKLGREVYIKLNKDTLVNSQGQVINIDLLPQFVTFYDKYGSISYYQK